MAMANSFRASITSFSKASTNTLFSSKRLQTLSVNRPPGYLRKPVIIVPKLPILDQNKVAIEEFNNITKITNVTNDKKGDNSILTKLHAILEVVRDRIEMHRNIKEQRENWNSLLLNSINMMTLTAATMVGLVGSDMGSSLGLKVSSTLLFASATVILVIMNKIQPSQLVEEQRNAVRLFKQLETKIQTTLSLQTVTEKEVEDAMGEVLALDRAYPLPLLGGAMLEKLPDKFKPAAWWPTNRPSRHQKSSPRGKNMNGWSEELEEDMRETVKVMRRKDMEEYVRLGNMALKLNKTLAIMGPLLTGIATVGSALSGHGGPWGGLIAAAAGSMASIVNTIEHGGQVGMVFEMYRTCAGFFCQLEDILESNLEEGDFGKRENGELFEMKMALYLGRSLSELRDFAEKSRNGGNVNEFGSKLF